MVITALVFHQLLGGLTFPIARAGLAVIEPFTFAFFRFVISALVLLAIVKAKNYRVPVAKEDYIKILGLGALIIPFNQVAYLFGQSLTTAGHGALLFATTPIWIFLGGIIHLKEKFVVRRAIGVVVGLTGVIVIMTSGALNLGDEFLLGDMIILLAVLAWAYYTILGKPLVKKYGAIRVTAYALSFGTALYFPFGIYRAAIFDYSNATLTGWLSVVYVALGVSVGAYILWYWVLKYMEASRVAVFHNLQPVLAATVAYIFLGEPIGWGFVIGGSVALAGVIITEV